MPTVKSLNYISAIRGQQRARAQGAVEALYCTADGILSECTTSNLFVFFGDQLVTPNVDVLPGITRGVALELAEDLFEVVQRPLHYDELATADEVFITSTTKELMPIVRIDDQPIGAGRPGPRTYRLLDHFHTYVHRRLRPSLRLSCRPTNRVSWRNSVCPAIFGSTLNPSTLSSRACQAYVSHPFNLSLFNHHSACPEWSLPDRVQRRRGADADANQNACACWRPTNAAPAHGNGAAACRRAGHTDTRGSGHANAATGQHRALHRDRRGRSGPAQTGADLHLRQQ